MSEKPQKEKRGPVAVTSMTGFASVEGMAAGYSWVWEVKSVNSKVLDLRFRLPAGFNKIEAEARKGAVKRFTRGSVSINLVVKALEKPNSIEVNREVLEKLTALAADFRGDAGVVNVEALMGLRGVIEVGEVDLEDEETIEKRNAVVTTTMEKALDELACFRLSEGERIAKVVEDHLQEISELTTRASRVAGSQPGRRKARLMKQLEELLEEDNSLSEERISQELALIIARGDVREELDRLLSHVAAARDLLAQGGAIGRRLDFLCQELNREANTLCSKSSDIDLTKLGLALKAAIERLREQIQNIE